MECTQVLLESDEELSGTQDDNRRQVATLKTNADAYPIFVGENRIGRDPKTCSVVIDNMALSSQHAVIEGLECGSFLVYDLHSRNKTRIGKMPLIPKVRYQLKNGENIRFANVLCTFSISEGIKLAKISFDDETETLATDTRNQKEESPKTSGLTADPDMSVMEESIFEKNTEMPGERAETPKKVTKESSEMVEHVFTMPGPSCTKSLNSSVASRNVTEDSTCSDVYDDDIFDLATQPFIRETGTGVLDDEEDMNQKDKGGGDSLIKPTQSPKKSPEYKYVSNLENLNISGTGNEILDSISSAKEEKSSDCRLVEETNEKTDPKQDISDEKYEDDEDTDVEDLFSAATEVFPGSNKTKEGHDEICERSDSYTGIKITGSKVVQKSSDGELIKKSDNDENGEDTDPEDIFSVVPPIKGDEKGEEETKEGDDLGGCEGRGEKSTAADSGLPLKGKVTDKEDNDNMEPGETEDSDDIFSSVTKRFTSKSRKKAKKGKDDFANGEDSDDDLFASKELPLSKDEEGANKGDLNVPSREDNDQVTENHFTAAVKGQLKKNEEKEIGTPIIGDSLGRVGSHAENDGDETDPEDTLAQNITKSEEKISTNNVKKKIKNLEANEKSGNESNGQTNDAGKLEVDSESSSVSKEKDDIKRNNKVNIHDSERKILTKTGDVGLNKNLNEVGKTGTEKKGEASPSRVVLDEGDDTDVEDMCPPSIKKPLPPQKAMMRRKKYGNSYRIGQSESDSEEKSSISSQSNGSISGASGSELTKNDVFGEVSRDISINKNDSTTGILADATLDDDKEMSAVANQSDCLVIMSDTDDEKEAEDTSSLVVTATESSGKQQSNEPIFSGQAEVNVVVKSDSEDEEDVSTNKDKTKDLEKVSSSAKQLIEGKGKTGDLDVLKQQDCTNKSPKPETDVGTTRGNLAIRSDTEDEENFYAGKSSLLDKNVVSEVSHKNMEERNEPSKEKSEINFPIEKSQNKVDPCESVSVTDSKEQMTAKNNDEKNKLVPSVEDNLAVVDMTVDITLPVPVIRVLSEKAGKLTNKCSIIKETVENETKDDSGTAEDADMEVSSFQTKPLESAKSNKDISLKEVLPDPNLSSFVDDNTENTSDEFSSMQTQSSPQVRPSEINDDDQDTDDDLDILQKQSVTQLKKPNVLNDIEKGNKSSLKTQVLPFQNIQSSKGVIDKKEEIALGNESEVDLKPPNKNAAGGGSSGTNDSKKTQPHFKTPKAVVNKECSDEEDLSSLETQPASSSTAPKTDHVIEDDDEEDLSLFETQSAPGLRTPDSVLNKEDNSEEDMSSFLTQVPPEFKTPKAVDKNVSDDDEDLSLLDTQPAPKSTNLENEEIDEEDMSSFLTQAPPEFKTPKAVDKNVSDDDEDLSLLDTQPAPKSTNLENKEIDEEDMRSFLTQAPPEFKTPKAVDKNVIDDDEDLSLLDTQPAPKSTNLENKEIDEEDMSSFLTQAPPEFKTPKAVDKNVSDDDEDLSLLDTQPAPKSTNLENEEIDEEDMSSFLTQAPPEFKTPKVVAKNVIDDDEDLSLLDTQPAPGLRTPDSVLNKEDNSEEDMSSFLTQVPPEFKTPKAVDKNVSDDDEDLSLLDTQPAPKSTNLENKEIDEEDMSSFLTQAPPEFKTPKAVDKNVSDDDEDLSLLDTQPAPKSTNLENKEIDEEDMSSFITQAPPEFKTPKAVDKNVIDDDDDLSLLDTQPAPSSKTSCRNAEDGEDMSSMVTEVSPNFKTPMVTVKIEPEDNEEMSSFLTQAPPDFKTPNAVDGNILSNEEYLTLLDSQPVTTSTPLSKNSEKGESSKENISSTLTKKAVNLKISSDDEDLNLNETQPAPTLKTVDQKDNNGDEKTVPSSAKSTPEFKVSTAAVENVSSDEEDLSLLESQPTPELKTPMVINGKQESIDGSKMQSVKFSNSSKIATPSRRSLRKTVLLKNEKDSAKKVPASPVKVEEELEEFQEQDDDSDLEFSLDLPDTPALVDTLKESKRSYSVARRNLFAVVEGEKNTDMPKKSNVEAKEQDNPSSSTENKPHKGQKQRSTRGKNINADMHNPNIESKTERKSETQEHRRESSKLAEVERRPPSRRNVGKLNQQSPEKTKLTPEIHSASNKRQRAQKNEPEISLPLKRKLAEPSSLSVNKEEPAPKRKVDLKEEMIKPLPVSEEKGMANQGKVAKDNLRASENGKSLKKANLRGRVKTESSTVQEGDDNTSGGDEIISSISKDQKKKVVVGKSETAANKQEVILRRGKRGKRDQNNDSKANETKEAPLILRKVDGKKDKPLGPLIGKGKNINIKELTVDMEDKLSISPEKKRSSYLSEVASSDKSSIKMEEIGKQAVEQDLKRDLSPVLRKRSLRGQTVKVLEANKEDIKTDLKTFSTKKNEKELSPVMFYGKLSQSPLREEAVESKKDVISPIILSRKGRHSEVSVSPVLKEKGDSSVSQQLFVKEGWDIVRRSSRERKPKRRFIIDKCPKDTKKIKTEDESIEAETISNTAGTRRGRKGKAEVKNVFPDSSTTSSQEDHVSQAVSNNSSKRKLEDKDLVRTNKRSRPSQEDVHKEDAYGITRGDRRSRRRGAATEDISNNSLTLAVEEVSSTQKGFPREEEEGRGGLVISKRGRRKSTTPIESLSPVRHVTKNRSEEVSTSQLEVPIAKDIVIGVKTVNTRGRKKSATPVKPIVLPVIVTREKIDRVSTSQEEITKEQDSGNVKGVRGRGRKKSMTPVKLVGATSLKEDEEETSKVESPKELGSGSGRVVRRRGRKNSNTIIESATSASLAAGKLVEEAHETQEEDALGIDDRSVKETKRRGRRGKSVKLQVPIRIVPEERVKKLRTPTLTTNKDRGVVTLKLSESKPVTGNRRTNSLQSRASSLYSETISELQGQEKSLRVRPQKSKGFNVLFTGLNEPKLEQIVQTLGGSVVETPHDCSILVTDRLRRTYKLLCAVARGIPIVTAQWLIQSSSSSRFLDPSDFLISDKLTEKRFDFTLKTSLEKAKTKPLLAGYTIIATSSVKPPPEEVQGIVTCAGGQYISTLSAMPSKIPERLYVVSCSDDSSIWKEYQEFGTKKNPSRGRSQRGKGKASEEPTKIRLIGVEGLLVSVLRQKIDFENEMFSLG